jgi:hypothetical protein
MSAKGSVWTLGDITASVPNTSGQQIYKDKQLLTISNISSWTACDPALQHDAAHRLSGRQPGDS